MAFDLSCSPIRNTTVNLYDGAADLRANTYICGTRHFESSTSNGLAFNVIRPGNVIGRWAKNSTISFYVSKVGLVQAQGEAVKTAMSVAASNWALSGLSVTFVEAVKEEDATLLVVYDRFLDASIFATAFFPGESRRIIDIGPRLLGSSEHMPNVLTHELGHVLGLRHELWDDRLPKEKSNVLHWPTTARDSQSIMNNHNANNLPLLILSDQDRRIIRDFYSLPIGQQGDFVIEDYVPTPVLSGVQGKVEVDGTITFMSALQ